MSADKHELMNEYEALRKPILQEVELSDMNREDQSRTNTLTKRKNRMGGFYIAAVLLGKLSEVLATLFAGAAYPDGLYLFALLITISIIVFIVGISKAKSDIFACDNMKTSARVLFAISSVCSIVMGFVGVANPIEMSMPLILVPTLISLILFAAKQLILTFVPQIVQEIEALPEKNKEAILVRKKKEEEERRARISIVQAELERLGYVFCEPSRLATLYTQMNCPICSTPLEISNDDTVFRHNGLHVTRPEGVYVAVTSSGLVNRAELHEHGIKDFPAEHKHCPKCLYDYYRAKVDYLNAENPHKTEDAYGEKQISYDYVERSRYYIYMTSGRIAPVLISELKNRNDGFVDGFVKTEKKPSAFQNAVLKETTKVLSEIADELKQAQHLSQKEAPVPTVGSASEESAQKSAASVPSAGLVTCVDCKKTFSARISACPHCGCPIEYSVQ